MADTTELEIDRLPIDSLLQRYGISRSVLYERMGGLRIKTLKVGGRSYIGKKAIADLDALHQHVSGGGTMAEFLELKNGRLAPLDKPGVFIADKPDTRDFIQLVHEIAAAIKPQSMELQHLECLERAADKGWLLSTSVVRHLIGVKPHGKTFARGSFTFVRSGKIGREVGWKVEKN